jgi:hypothetical protein
VSSTVIEPSIMCFSNGNMRIDWTSVLGFSCINVFKSWEGCLEGYVESVDSAEHDPVYIFDLPISLSESLDNESLKPWFNTIPQSVLNRCIELPSNQLLALYCVSKSRDAQDLLMTNPLLLHLWFRHHAIYLRNKPDEIPRRLERLKGKQISILQSIAPDATKASLKLLKKIDLKSMQTGQEDRMISILQRPALVSRLAHQEELSAKHFELADRYPWAVARPISSVLINLSRADHQLVNDTINMSDGRALKALASAQRWHDVLTCHDRWAREWNYGRRFTANILRDEYGQPLAFPLPPLEPTEDIIWLSSPSHVVDEGRRMKHCVAAYVQRVQRGEYALYRMEAPANLTIGLRKSVSGWQLDQVRGVCNRAPTKDEISRLDQWLLGG